MSFDVLVWFDGKETRYTLLKGVWYLAATDFVVASYSRRRPSERTTRAWNAPFLFYLYFVLREDVVICFAPVVVDFNCDSVPQGFLAPRRLCCLAS